MSRSFALYDRSANLSADDRRRLEAAQNYLRDTSGSAISLTRDERDRLTQSLLSQSGTVDTSGMNMRELVDTRFDDIDATIRRATSSVQSEVRAVEGTVIAAHIEEMNAINQIKTCVESVNKNVCILGENVGTIAGELASLSHAFTAYIAHDKLINNVHRAETKLVQLEQQLSNSYGHNNELRRTAVGILQAADLAAVRSNTILTRAEELCISAPNYWLGPALVALAQWVDGSQSSGNSRASEQVVYNTLKEAFIRDREKTSLFFGLVCLRANLIPEANKWFSLYVDMQRPEAVDRTCIMLLNIYAGGLMGHGEEERAILDTMQGWLDKLLEDGRNEQILIDDWINTIVLQTRRVPVTRSYRALSTFCPEWPQLAVALQSTHAHELLGGMLMADLAERDFKEGEEHLIDSMIATLVSSFDGDELPIRREQEYQKLIVDLGGDEDSASMLRVVKDDVLSETKSFLSIVSDASRESELSSASIATRQYATRLQIPQIAKAHQVFTTSYRQQTPRVITIALGDFAVTTDGTNEEEVVNAYVQHVNAKERSQLEASKTGALQMAALFGGLLCAVIGLIMAVAGAGIGGFLVLFLGAIAAFFGWRSYSAAKRRQDEIAKAMSRARTSGVLIIRMMMQELRTYRSEYARREELIPDLMEFLDANAATMHDGLSLEEVAAQENRTVNVATFGTSEAGAAGVQNNEGAVA